MKSENKSFFWASYADLMTSLFFVMLILFVIAIVKMDMDKGEAMAKTKELESKIEKANEINSATRELDSLYSDYFEYSAEFKKHRLCIEVNFEPCQSSMLPIPDSVKRRLIDVGHIMNDFINKKIAENEKIQYLLIIEGQASRDNWPKNYELSYERAYSLLKFWRDNAVRFENKNCEVIISGSGDGTIPGTGSMRDTIIERKNQRFLIHLLPKPGKIDEIIDEDADTSTNRLYR